MEDAHVVDLDVDGTGSTALFGVFDGHAGAEVAAFCARHIGGVLPSTEAYKAGDLEAALSEAYLQLELMMKDPTHRQELALLSAGLKPGRKRLANEALADSYGTLDEDGCYLGPKAGCTACVAAVRGEEMYVANVGDSRCVLCESGGTAVSLTRDHKPELSGEEERITKAGLSVVRNRVYGDKSSLAMTRALGDTKYKDPNLPPEHQAISPVPDTTQYIVGSAAGGCEAACPARTSPPIPGDSDPGAADAAEFMILACDGLWDSLSNEQASAADGCRSPTAGHRLRAANPALHGGRAAPAWQIPAVEFVRQFLQSGDTPQQAARALVEECLSDDGGTPVSTDNITVLIVKFEPLPAAAGNS
ncbi:hypothetical protein MNEG_5799 [Monoraphidium neglectum]|uniref:protein-serine/threonine phosphatase n=1 Tax=Monoraphidium neglectum TaxID=145388 RepID=A0A0D2JTF7_9CHLO|nr:hypothetical protein MNEG_5799 [Monoraphidium neglectum]KIZ02163.1 hypothetical protein MNEG_5799 [Monoraphidium neglectum]|eukprot:XP_013901182.1 hypothetical protein MNEG_5799 [Monoraphidium neglectum]